MRVGCPDADLHSGQEPEQEAVRLCQGYALEEDAIERARDLDSRAPRDRLEAQVRDPDHVDAVKAQPVALRGVEVHDPILAGTQFQHEGVRAGAPRHAVVGAPADQRVHPLAAIQ
jgi:hypothetical protein